MGQLATQLTELLWDKMDVFLDGSFNFKLIGTIQMFQHEDLVRYFIEIFIDRSIDFKNLSIYFSRFSDRLIFVGF